MTDARPGPSRRPGPAARCAVLLAASALLSGLGWPETERGDLTHSHAGPRQVAVDAVHQEQPTHLDVSSIFDDWSCRACLAQSRQAESSGAVAEAPYQSPAEARGAAAARAVPTRPETGRGPSRAPPPAP